MPCTNLQLKVKVEDLEHSNSGFLKTYDDFSSQYVNNSKNVVFSPWIILQDLSQKINVFFLVVMVVCLAII